MSLAYEKELDLVELSEEKDVSVCKLMDFKKFLYKKRKQERRQKAHQKQGELKGIRLSIRIGENDLKVKARKAEKFLKENYKVKVELILKGREHLHVDLGFKLISDFISLLSNAEVDQEPQKKGNSIIAIVKSSSPIRRRRTTDNKPSFVQATNKKL